MAQAYTEDQLVEKPAIALFAELVWQTVSAMEETFGPEGTLKRENRTEVVLVHRLRAALERLNPFIPADAIGNAVDELTRDRSAMLPEQANREVYFLLKDGIKVSVSDPENGGQKTERIRVIDWQSPGNNDFLFVSQFTVAGSLYDCRPDLVGFVNGLPLVVIELKKPGVPAKVAFDENLTSYKHAQNGIPALFWYNAFLIASNGTDSRIGSITADWDRFFEWKRIEREDEPRRVALEVMLRGTCDKARLLDVVENFTLFSEHKAGLVKIIGQNHQFLGVNNAIAAAMLARAAGHGRGGVFWQTQGSGKSFSMVFFAQKILRKVPGNWTFVVVTDRVELDDQIAKTFKAAGAVSEAESDPCHASSGAHLRELLRGNHRYVFTLVHKFQTPEMLCDRSDVIVLTDEAHRSQYDALAINMRSALPKALFLAFTGTPLIAGEERTKEVFGDYVSVYDFQQSVEDGATVPLFYENRTPELELVNPNLNEHIYDLIEEAALNEDAEKRLEKELGKQYHILTRDDRLETVAKDIVQHFLGRGFLGKAMVVSIDKATALRMHDKVRKHWNAERARVEKEIAKINAVRHRDRTDEELGELADLRRRSDVLTTTDMAVIVSPGQNEIEQMKKLGLDIVPHRQRINDEPLDENFRDPTHRLRLVFVCAMWLTGFDAPSCSTIYLDKPMRNHTLMQTIARANRVYPGKHSGLIVDYANVFVSLEKALAIYGAGGGGKTPVRNKTELIEDLRKAVTAARTFCGSHGVNVSAIESAPVTGFQRAQAITDAINTFASPDPLRKEYLAHERLVHALYRALKPDPVTAEFASVVACLASIADGLRLLTGCTAIDISGVMTKVAKLLDESIAAEGFRIVAEAGRGDDLTARPGILDLSKIDFAALAKRFKESKTKNLELEALKAAIRAQLKRMVRINRTRVNYLEKFEALIADYNAGSRNIDDLFEELLNLSRNLTDEQQRHVREHLTEEELTVFDILTRPDPELTESERAEVKKVAHLLLERLQSVIALDWRKQAAGRARVQEAISEVLDQGLPEAYTRQIYQKKCALLFEHVYDQRAM